MHQALHFGLEILAGWTPSNFIAALVPHISEATRHYESIVDRQVQELVTAWEVVVLLHEEFLGFQIIEIG